MEVKERNDLIYDLIFSNQTDYIIDISEYISDIYKFEEFVSDIKDILKRSKVSVVRHSVDVDSKTVIWKLRIKK
jgi:hypothetical protein